MTSVNSWAKSAVLGLAGEDDAAQIERLSHARFDPWQHRQGAGDVKAADGDGDPQRPQGPSQIQGAGELVGLHAGEHHYAAPGQRYFLGYAFGSHPGVGLVDGFQTQIDIGSQPLRLLDVLGQAVKTSQ